MRPRLPPTGGGSPRKKKPSDEEEIKNGPEKPNKTNNKPKTSRQKTKIRFQFHPKYLTRHHLQENQEQQLPQRLVFPTQVAGHQCQPHGDTCVVSQGVLGTFPELSFKFRRSSGEEF
jgi:hypothetical protein